MNRNKILIFLFFIFVSFSCNYDISLHYETYKEQYNEAVDCLLSNHASIFSYKEKKNSVGIFSTERINNFFCNNHFQLLAKHSLSIVSYYRDSTIFFYSSNSKGIKSKQTILVFTDDIRKLKQKMTTDMKFKGKKDCNWYKLEKVISIAN